MTEKAIIKVLDGENSNTEIEVMFNPESYHLSCGASYSEKKIAGLDSPVSQYISGESMTLDMTLFFDTYRPPTPLEAEGGTSVAAKTKPLRELTSPDGTLHRPPTVSFCWGTLHFRGVVTGVKENYTMFLADGTPVRAKVELSFHSVSDPDTTRRQTPFESPDRTKIRVLHENEQLWNYAYLEYGDAAKWREIARANGILNPLALTVGMQIHLPALQEEDEDGDQFSDGRFFR